MSSKEVIKALTCFLDQPLMQRGLSLWDMEFVKEGPEWFFRIYIDRDSSNAASGVQIDDCEFISRAAEEFLDDADPIPQSYTLEVCSPGLDRALKREADFIRYVGHTVDLKLFKARNGRKKFQGELKKYADGVITINEAEGEAGFDRADVASCRLTVIL